MKERESVSCTSPVIGEFQEKFSLPQSNSSLNPWKPIYCRLSLGPDSHRLQCGSWKLEGDQQECPSIPLLFSCPIGLKYAVQGFSLWRISPTRGMWSSGCTGIMSGSAASDSRDFWPCSSSSLPLPCSERTCVEKMAAMSSGMLHCLLEWSE